MKRFLAFLLTCTLALSLAGCSQTPSQSQPSQTMQLAPAKLSEEEEQLSQLLGGSPHIYDFTLDDTARSMSTSVYELGEDGQWQELSGGTMVLDGPADRIGLTFDKIPNGVRTAIQSSSGTTGSSNTREDPLTFPDMSTSTTQLSQSTEVEYGTEYPLVLQIMTTKDVVNLVMDDFYTPENYQSMGYEHVYVITVSFSQEAVQ